MFAVGKPSASTKPGRLGQRIFDSYCPQLLDEGFGRMRDDFRQRWMVMRNTQEICRDTLIIHHRHQLMNQFSRLGTYDLRAE